MQSTWAASSDTWDTTHVWANDTYTSSATMAGTSGVTDNATASFPVSADITQILLSELHEEDRVSLLNGTLGSALGISSSCSVAIPVSGNFDADVTGSGIGGFTFVGNAVFTTGLASSDSATTVYPSTATFSSVLENVNDEDKITLINASLGATYGIITGSVLKAVGVATLPTSTGVVNNINYPESVSMSTNTSSSSASNFLWNAETESSDTWTTSTEATTTWTDATEDTTTEWNNQ